MGLALVVIEEHAGRAMHLRDDDALGAVDDEGAVIGHERDVAHVDILLFDVFDRFGAGFLIGIKYDEPQCDLERRGIGHAALSALINVVFRRLEFVFDEFQHRRVGEIRNREDRLEDGLEAFIGPAASRLLYQQELVVGRLLNLNEVRHLRDFLDFSEKLSYALPTDKRLRHHILSLNRTIGFAPAATTAPFEPSPRPDAPHRQLFGQLFARAVPRQRGDQDDSPDGRNPSRPSGQASLALLFHPTMGDSAHVRIAAMSCRTLRSAWSPAVTLRTYGFSRVLFRLAPGPPLSKRCLLKLNLGADFFELRLDLGRVVLADAFLHILRCAFDQVLGLFQAEASNGADLLDDFDLFLPSTGENDRKLGLFFGSRRSRRAGASGARGNRDRGGGRYAPLLFEKLGEFRRLQHREAGKIAHYFLQISHEFFLRF